jgi:hypothetical protein
MTSLQPDALFREAGELFRKPPDLAGSPWRSIAPSATPSPPAIRKVPREAPCAQHLDQSQKSLSESFGEEPADSVIPAAWRRAGGQ